MTAEDVDGFDYAAVVVVTLREAGGPISDEELWERVMSRSDVPPEDREGYWTPPFKPGPYPRNIVKLKLSMSLMSHTDMGGLRPDAPLITTEEGYWLPEWGPIPLIEQQRRAELAEMRAREASEPKPKVWPEFDPYPKSSKAGENELRDVAEKLVAHRTMVSSQRRVGPGSSTLKRVMEKRLEAEGKLDEARRVSAERERMTGVLMEWYGNAVRRTDDADPQDLFVLMRVGFIRNPEETTPPRTETQVPSLTSSSTQSSAGCYIATSVYGDYDAPQVRVLRLWRDRDLNRSLLGRGFVRVYYAVSPSLVRTIGGRRWFSMPSRWVLDQLVRKLDS
ncbi:CFI-box-CTERM domain-containing protein [Demequina aurantiaca]|uniref:CFI-box-CTERM domain-containing protein n=1 Tax=Demequina aurantiaca TaxID=676200 RepID=UPI003D34CD68